MNAHIEFDDFGEYIEVLDDFYSEQDFRPAKAERREASARRILRGLLYTLAAMTVMATTTSFAVLP